MFDPVGKYFDYRRIGWTVLDEGLDTQVIISTVWLGMDHNFAVFGEPHTPLIFETMIFSRRAEDGDDDLGEDQYQNRYPTEESALAGHDQAVQWAKDNLFVFGDDIKITERHDRSTEG